MSETSLDVLPAVLPVEQLLPHPLNPRLVWREDTIATIAAELRRAGKFWEAHAPSVRPYDGAYQIIAGHHRVEAAKRAELQEIPCWVRDLDDDEAFMQLVLSNTQEVLSPIELGMHVLQMVQLGTNHGRGQKGGLRAYAKRIGKTHNYLVQLRQAAEVLHAAQEAKVVSRLTTFLNKSQHLTALQKLPQACWPAVSATHPCAAGRV